APADLTIREARPDDARELAEVHVQSWKVAYRGMIDDAYLDALRAEDRLDRWVERVRDRAPRNGVLVAERAGRIVGFLGVSPLPDRGPSWALIPQLYLHPDAIGTGVGRSLMAAALERLRADGVTHVEL